MLLFKVITTSFNQERDEANIWHASNLDWLVELSFPWDLAVFRSFTIADTRDQVDRATPTYPILSVSGKEEDYGRWSYRFHIVFLPVNFRIDQWFIIQLICLIQSSHSQIPYHAGLEFRWIQTRYRHFTSAILESVIEFNISRFWFYLQEGTFRGHFFVMFII